MFLDQLEALVLGRYDVPFFCRYWLGIDYNSFQERICEETYDSPENLIIAGNRSGKTAWLATNHIHANFYKLGLETSPLTYENQLYRTFNVSPIFRQAKESFRYIEQIMTGSFTWRKNGKIYSNAPNEETGDGLKIRDFIVGQNETMGEIRFANNSIHYSMSTGHTEGAAFQGLPAGYISFDECVESQHLESEIGSMVSRLGDYGYRFDLITSPRAADRNNSQQHLYHIYKEAKKLKDGLPSTVGYRLVTGTYSENVFIPEDQKKRHRERVMRTSPALYEQIINGQFITLGTKMFAPEVIDHIWMHELKELINPEDGHKYLISVDWGFADQGDETVFLVFDYTYLPWRIVKALAVQGGDPWKLMAELTTWRQMLNNARVIMDTNSMGGTVMRKQLKALFPISFDSHGEQKIEALSYLQLALTKGRDYSIINGEATEKNPNYGYIRSLYLPRLEEQLGNYQQKDDKIEQDWVVALYQGIYLLWKELARRVSGRDRPHTWNPLKNLISS
jgi:hypothetical protein